MSPKQCESQKYSEVLQNYLRNVDAFSSFRLFQGERSYASYV